MTKEQRIEIKKDIKVIEDMLNGEGRVLVRASGTEPLIRVMIEGPSMEQITFWAEELKEKIRVRFG